MDLHQRRYQHTACEVIKDLTNSFVTMSDQALYTDMVPGFGEIFVMESSPAPSDSFHHASYAVPRAMCSQVVPIHPTHNQGNLHSYTNLPPDGTTDLPIPPDGILAWTTNDQVFEWIDDTQFLCEPAWDANFEECVSLSSGSPSEGTFTPGTEEIPANLQCTYPGCRSKTRFTRKCDLRKHIKRHFIAFHCRHKGCPRASEHGFSTKKDRERHEARHDPQIGCAWEGCNRLFSRMDNMKDHVRRVHLRTTNSPRR
ncbi:Trichothecene biosynthesis transcription regulator TRI6 [Pseudocercospora fuligena]|uniref:Trichothecene biosynthesis transcription regulator TRI6 n=1 Tax=Pseudocercospora fuligena TaxID=685502 RepID=A0A8H6RLF5_9PEZI|nr:Trichothecene biosynthesis transcription regulator TRI6 [Pseudocercospora fuligena]